MSGVVSAIMGTAVPTQQAPAIPAPPPPPPPQPDINGVKNDIMQNESLSRKPRGLQGNILTGQLGNTNNLGSASKTLLG